MSLFSRRRLVAMLRDIAPLFQSGRQSQLIGRLTSSRVDQVLPAQMELALLWGLSQIGKLTLEPELPGSTRRPDALSETLIAGRSTLIEIAALTNARLSGEESMVRTVRLICQFAARIKPASKDHLFFTFGYANEYLGGRLLRKRLVDEGFDLTADIKNDLRTWLAGPLHDESKLRLITDTTNVCVSWREQKQTSRNFFSPMPSEAQNIEDNPLWDILKSKAKQLRHIAPKKDKCVFLADVGSDLLRKIDDSDRLQRTFNGAQIIRHFLEKNPDSFDLVCVFSPNRARPAGFGSYRPIKWKVTAFAPFGANPNLGGLTKLAECLPVTLLEGYQARSLHQQNSSAGADRRLHCATSLSLKGAKMTLSISSRAVLSLLAGKITHPEFLRLVEMDRQGFPNQFELRQKAGDAITEVRFDGGGLDSDDDHIAFDFGPDPAFDKILKRMPK